ncbi:hypothetical protein DFJ73DRAFT_111527 [Zopfochytrium polystomum]|nr:hypothetical protein DFJ73DRAFT_111527 [Zopfochytrium polystomum]
MDSEAVRRWIAQHPSEALHLFEAHLKPAVASATDATTITTTNTTTSRAGAAAIAAVSPTSPLSSAGSPTRLHHHTHEDGLQRLPADLLFYYYRSVHASLNLRTILSRVLSIAVTVVRAERCSVFLVDESKNELYSAAWNVGSRYLAPRPAASDDDDDDRASDSNGGSDSSSSRRTGTSARKRGKRSWSAMHSGEDLFNLPTKVSRMSSSAGLSHANAVVLTESSDDDVDGGGGGGRKGSGVASWSNEGGDGFRGNDHSAHGTANDGSAYHPLTTAAVDAADYADDEQMDDEETVRIPIGVGIAGTVAETKKGLNVADAYLYPGFNREIDARSRRASEQSRCSAFLYSEGGRKSARAAALSEWPPSSTRSLAPPPRTAARSISTTKMWKTSVTFWSLLVSPSRTPKSTAVSSSKSALRSSKRKNRESSSAWRAHCMSKRAPLASARKSYCAPAT